jgi:hypothetical protein
MTNNKQQTAVDQIVNILNKEGFAPVLTEEEIKFFKEMEKEQIGYSKEDVLTAGEMGEINTHDTKHIVSYLDEAKQFNETYGGNE